eukprot:370734-Pelagomonas_calceolata.AAC.1
MGAKKGGAVGCFWGDLRPGELSGRWLAWLDLKGKHEKEHVWQIGQLTPPGTVVDAHFTQRAGGSRCRGHRTQAVLFLILIP